MIQLLNVIVKEKGHRCSPQNCRRNCDLQLVATTVRQMYAVHISVCVVLLIAIASGTSQEGVTIHITGPVQVVIGSAVGGTTQEGHKGCPKGFFMLNGSKQCFKYFSDEKRNWTQANSKCAYEGLHLAKPSDAVAVTLRKYIIDTFGEGNVWLDARGDGAKFMWQRDRTELRRDNPLWWPQYPGRAIDIDDCLYLAVWESHLSGQPQRPYITQPCLVLYYTLCEMVPTAEQCTEEDGFCVETGDRCNGTIKILHNSCDDHCTCCVPDNQVCPEGFIMSKASKQCFKLFNDVLRSWEEANIKCEEEGLVTAKTSGLDAATLRKDLLDTYGDVGWVWLGAQGNGQQMVWQHTGERIRNLSPLWHGGMPGIWVTPNHCLTMVVLEDYWRESPGGPYFPSHCSDRTLPTLCEVKMS